VITRTSPTPAASWAPSSTASTTASGSTRRWATRPPPTPAEFADHGRQHHSRNRSPRRGEFDQTGAPRPGLRTTHHHNHDPPNIPPKTGQLLGCITSACPPRPPNRLLTTLLNLPLTAQNIIDVCNGFKGIINDIDGYYAKSTTLFDFQVSYSSLDNLVRHLRRGI